MACEIVWSADAKDDYFNVLAYLLENWSLAVVNEFIDRVNYKLEMVSTNTALGKMSKHDKNIRSVVITSHNKLYYQHYEGAVEVLNIFDTRQDAVKNRFE